MKPFPNFEDRFVREENRQKIGEVQVINNSNQLLLFRSYFMSFIRDTNISKELNLCENIINI
jgi:hypothetical protein